jgi:hypothetical protein
VIESGSAGRRRLSIPAISPSPPAKATTAMKPFQRGSGSFPHEIQMSANSTKESVARPITDQASGRNRPRSSRAVPRMPINEAIPNPPVVARIRTCVSPKPPLSSATIAIRAVSASELTVATKRSRLRSTSSTGWEYCPAKGGS